MRGYTGFLIAPFESGISKQLEPWLTPDKAFVDLKNVYIDRGILKEREGSSLFGQLGRIVVDEEWDIGDGTTDYDSGGAATDDIPIIPGSLTIVDPTGVQTLTDDGNGALTGDGSGTVVYSTGKITVSFTAVVANPNKIYANYHYSDTGTDRVVRGLHQWNKEDLTTELLGIDKKRLSVWDETLKYFYNVPSGTAITAEQLVAAGHGGGTAFGPVTTANTPVIPFTVVVYSTTSGQYLYDDGNGNFLDSVGRSGTGTIVYSTGTISVTFEDTVLNADPVLVSYRYLADPAVYDNWNSGNLAEFIDWANVTWIIDNISNIRVYDGTYATDITPRLKLNDDGHLLTSAKQGVVFNERLLFFYTIENGVTYPNRLRWHAQGNPFTVDAWRDDIDGQGDFNDAPVDDIIVSVMPFKNFIVVFFKKTIGFVEYTGDPALPFRWRMLNIPVDTSAPFGSWNLEKFVVSTGKDQLTACDGVGVQKANTSVPDFSKEIDYDKIDLCYGKVIPQKKQAWLAYASQENAGYPDTVLVYNYENNVISEYVFLNDLGTDLIITCLENYYFSDDATYTDLNNATYWPEIREKITALGRSAYWEDYADYSYGELSHQSDEQFVLAGSIDGKVCNVTDKHAVNDNGWRYNFNIVTKRFNPYHDLGVSVSLGHIDFLVSSIEDCEIEVKFYLGFTDNEAITKSFTCDGSGTKVLKRVYCNSTAPVISYSISHKSLSDTRQDLFELHAHKPYFKTGGRVI